MYFAVWAPHAKSVGVVGDFNGMGSGGVSHEAPGGFRHLRSLHTRPWNWRLYKFAITTKDDKILFKADPYAFSAEFRPGTASITTDISGFSWSDEKWMEKRKQTEPEKAPMAIYEVHLGSWRKASRPEKEGYYTYKERPTSWPTMW